MRSSPCQLLSAPGGDRGTGSSRPQPPAPHPRRSLQAAQEIATGSTWPSVAGPLPLRTTSSRRQRASGTQDPSSAVAAPLGSRETPGAGAVPRREKSQRTAPSRTGRLPPAPQKRLCGRRVSPGRSWPKRNGPRTPDLVGKGRWVFLPGHRGCVLSRSSHAHPNDREFCGF